LPGLQEHEAPAQRHKLALAVPGDAHHERHVAREDCVLARSPPRGSRSLGIGPRSLWCFAARCRDCTWLASRVRRDRCLTVLRHVRRDGWAHGLGGDRGRRASAALVERGQADGADGCAGTRRLDHAGGRPAWCVAQPCLHVAAAGA
jgi:hypothetical protein